MLKHSELFNLFGDSICNPFGEHCSDHSGNDEFQAAGQFEHDHHERHGHSGDAAQHCSRTHHRVQTGHHTVLPDLTTPVRGMTRLLLKIYPNKNRDDKFGVLMNLLFSTINTQCFNRVEEGGRRKRTKGGCELQMNVK